MSELKNQYRAHELMHTTTPIERGMLNMPFEVVLAGARQFVRQGFDFGYLYGGKPGIMGTAQNVGANIGKRMKSFGKEMFNFNSTKAALEDMRYDWYRMWKGGSKSIGGATARLAKSVPLAGLSVLDVGVGLATDIAKKPAAIGGAMAGAAFNLSLIPIGMAGVAAFKLGKVGLKLGAKVAPTLGKWGAMGAGHLVDTVATAAGNSAKFAWKHRRSKLLGTAFILGAMALGGARGYKENQISADMGMVSPDVQRPAWAVQGGTNPQGYKDIKTQWTPAMLDDLGASGDMAFALHNIRNGG